MEKRVRRAMVWFEFPYPDICDDLAPRDWKGPDGEMVRYNTSKGGGGASVDAYVDYGDEGHPYDTEYFEKLFDEATSYVRYNTGRTEIKYTFIE